MRLIDADELLNDLIFPTEQFEKGFREMINDALTVEAEQVRHGHWVKLNRTPIHRYNGDYNKYFCSRCGRVITVQECDELFIKGHFPYCHCGAKMDEAVV